MRRNFFNEKPKILIQNKTISPDVAGTKNSVQRNLDRAEALEVRADYVAPAFGFQKNFPFDDQAELERRVEAAWKVCRAFGCSIGFHSGSGKSPDYYRLVGRFTGGNLEIKTSGRYT